MKKGMTIDDYMNELNEQKERAEAFRDVIRYIDRELEWKCDRVVEVEGYYEDVVNEETGEVERKWHSAVYKVDENGEYVRTEPAEDSYGYAAYIAMKNVRAEIMAIV